MSHPKSIHDDNPEMYGPHSRILLEENLKRGRILWVQRSINDSYKGLLRIRKFYPETGQVLFDVVLEDGRIILEKFSFINSMAHLYWSTAKNTDWVEAMVLERLLQ